MLICSASFVGHLPLSSAHKIRTLLCGINYSTKSTLAGNSIESSSVLMFTYAFQKGSRLGYLSASYHGLAREGMAIHSGAFCSDRFSGKIILTGTVTHIAMGATPENDGSDSYYLNAPMVSDDPKESVHSYWQAARWSCGNQDLRRQEHTNDAVRSETSPVLESLGNLCHSTGPSNARGCGRAQTSFKTRAIVDATRLSERANKRRTSGATSRASA